MKLRNQNSTQPQIFDGGYKHPWYDAMKKPTYRIADDCPKELRKPVYELSLNKPNPPTQEAVEQAKFIDKTYQWNPGGDGSVRSRNKRTST